MSIEQDLEKLLLLEKRLRFRHFDSEAARAIGTARKAAADVVMRYQRSSYAIGLK